MRRDDPSPASSGTSAVPALTAAQRAGDDAEVLRLAERVLARSEGSSTVSGEVALIAAVHALAAAETCRTAGEAASWAGRAAALLERSERPGAVLAVRAVVTAFTTAAGLAADVEQARAAAEAATRVAAGCSDRDVTLDASVALCWSFVARRSERVEARAQALQQVRTVHAAHAEPTQVLDEALGQSLYLWGAVQSEGPAAHLRLLREIEDLRTRHPRSGPLAAALAIATWNARCAGVSGLRPNDLALHFEEVATHLPDQEFDLDDVIARFLELALASTLAGTPAWEECTALGARLERVALRQSPPVGWIDAVWISAYGNRLLTARPADERRAVVELCERAASRHAAPVLEIDENWASAVIYAAAAGEGADVWEAALEQVEGIAARHPDQTAPESPLQRGREICAAQLARAR